MKELNELRDTSIILKDDLREWFQEGYDEGSERSERDKTENLIRWNWEEKEMKETKPELL